MTVYDKDKEVLTMVKQSNLNKGTQEYIGLVFKQLWKSECTCDVDHLKEDACFNECVHCQKEIPYPRKKVKSK